jgi:3-oxoacyl-[acyl-carrier-protein] synthase II
MALPLTLPRIVVTGLGTVTPHGVGVETFWQALLAGASGVRPTQDPSLAPWTPVLAGVPDFDPSSYLSKKLTQDAANFTHMALVAATEAVQGAQLVKKGDGWSPQTSAEHTGIFMGTSFGAVRGMDEAAAGLERDPNYRISPRLVSQSIPNAPAAALAIRYGVRGPVLTYTTACASAANALSEALNWLRSGRIDVALAGGSDSLFAPALLAGLRRAGALVTDGEGDPTEWSRPFDKRRSGMVMGEGAAVLVLEPLERARARGAPIYAELLGYGISNDGFHQIAPHPEGEGAILAMKMALDSAGISIHDLDYINAHATSTKAGDAAEIKALRRLFGDTLDTLPVSSIKGSIGHSLGAAGAVESVACIKSLQTGWLPPNLHCECPEEGAPKHLLEEAVHCQGVRTILSSSFGFGGQNGVLVWGAVG